MKTFVAATLVALAAVATAQLPDVPDCSLNCFITPLTTDGCENLEDFACHCQKADSLFAAVTPCVKENCTPAEEADVISKVKDTCAANGVTVSIPDASSTPAGSSTPTPTPSATTTESTTESATTTETETSTSVAETSSSVSAVPTASGNGTAPTTAPSPSASEFPGAAARVTQAVGVLGAAAIAMLAL
ncbi:hypothetical protein K458DRAFT_382690 [Lentithecium fluviatile CBS 122367]|uniref:CFEM domain-containing protein n=1 Tax=Lentithecium fluviatile CBS 122367 TaxID=1168545 RepID=A0A6G1JKN7_9PLEO|nr:hypothetical protein K458DRAFT_382690 [Lentithecium fluviatile CBS 122367]